MIKTLEHIQRYAPSKEVERELTIPTHTGQETVKLKEKKYSTTIVGGDQLTVSRIRGSQRVRGNSDTSEERLDGLLPVSEDWHAKMCFMEVRLNFSFSLCAYM
jgi:L1 cell adhesion molecule like protein